MPGGTRLKSVRGVHIPAMAPRPELLFATAQILAQRVRKPFSLLAFFPLHGAGNRWGLAGCAGRWECHAHHPVLQPAVRTARRRMRLPRKPSRGTSAPLRGE